MNDYHHACRAVACCRRGEWFNRNKRADMESAPTVNWVIPQLRWNEQLPPYSVGVGAFDDPCTKDLTKIKAKQKNPASYRKEINI